MCVHVWVCLTVFVCECTPLIISEWLCVFVLICVFICVCERETFWEISLKILILPVPVHLREGRMETLFLSFWSLGPYGLVVVGGRNQEKRQRQKNNWVREAEKTESLGYEPARRLPQNLCHPRVVVSPTCCDYSACFVLSVLCMTRNSLGEEFIVFHTATISPSPFCLLSNAAWER